MRNPLSLASIFAFFFANACEKPSTGGSPEVEEQVPSGSAVSDVLSFPLKRNLKNKEGKEIEVTIIGRDMDSITFIRTTDNRRFSTPLETFSPVDQEFLQTLPLTAAPAKEVIGESEKDSDDEKGFSSFVKARKERIVEIRNEMEAIDDKTKLRTTKSSEQKRLFRAKEKLLKEIANIEEEIRQFQEFQK